MLASLIVDGVSTAGRTFSRSQVRARAEGTKETGAFATSWRPTRTLACALLLGLVGATACSEKGADPSSGEDLSEADLTAQVQAEMDGAPKVSALTLANLRAIRPVLKCVEKVSATSYRAHFGYSNSSSGAIAIPVGFNNRFIPGPSGRGQPTHFAPGTQADVVQVPFAANGLSLWVLGLRFDIATSRSPRCPTTGGTGGAGTGGAGGRGTGGVGTGGVGTGGSGTGGQAQCPSTCDDHNPCTVDLCNASTGFSCSNVAAPSGTSCSDGNACTVGDFCADGACTPGTARTCLAADTCHAVGVCDPTTGACSNPAVPNDTSCSDGNQCNGAETCQLGVCVSGTPVTCVASDQCHVPGVCDPATGVCSNPAAAPGTPCSDGNACSNGDTCNSGVCLSGAPVLCPPASDQCHASACDATTGGCLSTTVADGTACNDGNACTSTDACHAGVCAGTNTCTPLQNDVQNIVVIYAENRSFDGLFGNFPGARGLSEVVDATGAPTAAYIAQKDRDGSTVLGKLPLTWNGVTAPGNLTVVTQAQSDNLVNAPFGIENAYVANGGAVLTTLDVTRDIAHRFFENIMEINGGTNDQFAAFEDAGGLTMGHWDNSQKSLYALAQQYVLADNFFEGAYGGSFLNHQYLICGCAPTVPGTFITTNHPSLNVLGSPNAKGVPQLATNASSPPSALTGPPSFQTGNIAPLDYFGTGDGYRAVNTMQPPYQPSGNFPATGATDLRYANPAAATTLPPQTQTTVGDLLTAKGVGWAWYATSYTAASADGAQAAGATHTVIYAPSSPRGSPDFQAHHHPYNYYAAFDPATQAASRSAHLKDYSDMVSDIAAGTLPPVAWYKPTGYVNQHPGYANVDDGDAHIADLVNKLKAGPQWGHMVIVITYDEYGGQWDHVAPPKGDLIGPGTRIPAIIISPYAKMGTVDHTQYDSASTLRLITNRFALAPLAGLTARDSALVANGGTPMGDLTNALSLP